LSSTILIISNSFTFAKHILDEALGLTAVTIKINKELTMEHKKTKQPYIITDTVSLVNAVRPQSPA
jgi:hypothetical protein